MSRNDAHPALYAPNITHSQHDPNGGPEHFVPEGWEDFDRGLCPCGEAVMWNQVDERWEPERSLRVFVLTPSEAVAARDMLALGNDGSVPFAYDMVDRQLRLQDEIENYTEDTE
jgi:hypothetical protein